MGLNSLSQRALAKLKAAHAAKNSTIERLRSMASCSRAAPGRRRGGAVAPVSAAGLARSSMRSGLRLRLPGDERGVDSGQQRRRERVLGGDRVRDALDAERPFVD